MISNTDAAFSLGKSFVKKLNAANRIGDPFNNQFGFSNTGKPIVNGELREFPSAMPKRTFLSDILVDPSDRGVEGVVDLDKAVNAEEFLQRSIENRVKKENQLSESGIRVKHDPEATSRAFRATVGDL